MTSGDALTQRAKESYLIFAKQMVEQFQQWAKLTGVPEVQDVRIRFTDSGAKQEIISEPSFWKLLVQHDPDFTTAIGLAADSARIHLNAGIFKPPELSDASGARITEPSFEQIKPVLARSLLDVVMRSLNEVKSLSFDADKFESIYALYVADWASTERRNKALVPLLNLTLSTELRFAPNVELAIMDNSEKTELYNVFKFQALSLGETIVVSGSQYKLVGYYFDDEKLGPGFGQILNDVFNVVTAFRLLKAGRIGAQSVIYRPESTVSEFYGGTFLNDFQVHRWDGEYKFHESETAPLLSLYELLKKGNNSYVEPLRTAIRRFNQSYGRRTAEDRILDLTIALESSLLSGLKDELLYRLGMRGAALLADTDDPILTNAVLQSVYEIRSQIVHEGRGLFELEDCIRKVKKIDKSIDIGKIPELCEDLVRKILKAYLGRLSSGRKLADVNSELDLRPLRHLKG